MIPTSSNCVGWSLFQRELKNFFTSAKPVSLVEVSSKNGGGEGGQFAGGDQNGKPLSTYGHQQKFRNFEKFGAILGQNGIPELPTVNGSVLNGKVSVINGRPMRNVTFKLTPALLALRVSKPEDGKRFATYMVSKVFNWPKASSGGLEPINQSGGLVKAHPMETDSSLKGTLVIPVPLIERCDGQRSWVQGDSLSAMEAPRSPVTMVLLMSIATLVIAAMLSLVIVAAPMIVAAPALASATKAFRSLVTTVSPVNATEGSVSKFSGVEVSNRRLKAKNQTSLAGVLEDGSTAKLMGPGYVVHLLFGIRELPKTLFFLSWV